MDRDLWRVILLIGIVLIFGGWQGLYNIGIGMIFLSGLVIFILITFFKWDLIVAVVKWVFGGFFRRRRI